MLESKQLYLEKIHTSENGSNMLTKCLPKEMLEVVGKERAWLSPRHEAEGEIYWVRPFVWAGPMGKAHCLSEKNKIKAKYKKESYCVVTSHFYRL